MKTSVLQKRAGSELDSAHRGATSLGSAASQPTATQQPQFSTHEPVPQTAKPSFSRPPGQPHSAPPSAASCFVVTSLRPPCRRRGAGTLRCGHMPPRE